MKTRTQLTVNRLTMNATVLLTAILLAAPASQAQQVTTATLFYKPGDVIRLLVTFDGPGVDQISEVHARLGITTAIKPDQKGFETAVQGGTSKPDGASTFIVELRVPDIAADGQYRLELIYVNFKDSRPQAQYNQPEIPDLRVQIRDSKHFENPRVKTVTELH